MLTYRTWMALAPVRHEPLVFARDQVLTRRRILPAKRFARLKVTGVKPICFGIRLHALFPLLRPA